MKSISFNLSIAVISRLCTGGINLIIIGILTRALGAHEYGSYSAIFAYLYLFTATADLGLYTIFLRDISRSEANESFIASNILSMRLVTIIGAIAIALLALIFLPYASEIRSGIFIVSLFSISSSLVQLLTAVFQKYLRLTELAIADMVPRIIHLVSTLVIFYLGLGLMTFLWSVVIVELIHFVLVFLLARRSVLIGLAFHQAYWLETLKKSLPIAASLIFVLAYFKLDTVMISLMKPTYDVGVYSVSYKILETVIFIPAMYIGLIMPFLSKYALVYKEKFVEVFHEAFRVITIGAIPCGIYLFVLAPRIISLIVGSGFGESVLVLRILALAIIFIFFGNLGGNAIIALNLQNRGLVFYGIGALMNVLANLVLIPRYSYIGAAWTTVGTEIFITCAMFYVISRHINIKIDTVIIGKSILASFAMLAIIYPFRDSLVLGTMLAIIYFPILFVLKGITRQDIRQVLLFKRDRLAIEPEA